MVQLALRIPVFIASPPDVVDERNIIEKQIARVSRRCLERGLVLEPIRWETQARPGWGRPQDLLNQHVRRAELVVVILWSRLGSPADVHGTETGTAEEFRIAQQFVSSGASDDVFVYFRRFGPPESASIEAYDQVQQMRSRLHASKAILTWDYSNFRRFFGNVQWTSRAMDREVDSRAGNM